MMDANQETDEKGVNPIQIDGLLNTGVPMKLVIHPPVESARLEKIVVAVYVVKAFRTRHGLC